MNLVLKLQTPSRQTSVVSSVYHCLRGRNTKEIEKDKKETNRETDKVRVKKSEKHKINLEKDRKKLTEKLLK